MRLLYCHMIAYFAGFILDCIFGDPEFLPHPVVFIGKLISFFEKKLLHKEDTSSKKRFAGFLEVLFVCTITVFLSFIFIFLSYRIHFIAGIVVEAYFTYKILAFKCLRKESLNVYNCLKTKSLEESRKAVSRIVGRDTENLTEEEVCKACVETVAENTCDGVIAPLFYLALGGPVAGFFYKAVNTMDSMIGYKNEKYIDFGRRAAKLDDVLNFLPARISGLLIIFSSACLGKKYSSKNAWRIFKRDRYRHASPNSGQSESACAGALGLKLAGPAFYEGKKEEKPFIGDELRKIEKEDIKRSNALLLLSSLIFEILALTVIFELRFI